MTKLNLEPFFNIFLFEKNIENVDMFLIMVIISSMMSRTVLVYTYVT